MPIYDFKCEDIGDECGIIFEELVSSKTKAVWCPKCMSPAQRQLSAPHIGNQFRKAWDRAPPNPQRNDGPRRKARVDK